MQTQNLIVQFLIANVYCLQKKNTAGSTVALQSRTSVRIINTVVLSSLKPSCARSFMAEEMDLEQAREARQQLQEVLGTAAPSSFGGAAEKWAGGGGEGAGE